MSPPRSASCCAEAAAAAVLPSPGASGCDRSSSSSSSPLSSISPPVPDPLAATAVDLLGLASRTLQQPQQAAAVARHLRALGSSGEPQAARLRELAALRLALDVVLADATDHIPETIDMSTKHDAAVDDKVTAIAGGRLLGGMPPSSSACAKSKGPPLGALSTQPQSLAYLLQPPQPADPLATLSLVTEVFDFLASPSNDNGEGNKGNSSGNNAVPDMQALRATLHALSRVCRLWRDVALGDRYWRAPATALLPALAAAAATATATAASVGEKDGRSYRKMLLAYGRCLAQPSVRDGDLWQACLELSFEVIDDRDGLRLFSAVGPVDLILSSESGLTALRLTGPNRREVARPFSAASRDPGAHRFRTVKEFFAQGSQTQYPAALRVRVVAKDLRTGRQALLYQSRKATQRSVKVSTLQYWRQWLRPGSLFVWEPWSRWSAGDGAVHGSYDGPGEVVEISSSFYVSPLRDPDTATAATGTADQQQQLQQGPPPLPNAQPTEGANAMPQEGQQQEQQQQEQQRQQLPYAVTGGDAAHYGNHNSFIALQFRTLDASIPGRYIRAALAASPPPPPQRPSGPPGA